MFEDKFLTLKPTAMFTWKIWRFYFEESEEICMMYEYVYKIVMKT